MQGLNLLEPSGSSLHGEIEWMCRAAVGALMPKNTMTSVVYLYILRVLIIYLFKDRCIILDIRSCL